MKSKDIIQPLKTLIKKILGYIRVSRGVARYRNNLKVIVGSANTYQSGWISTDYPLLNLADGESFASLFKPNSVGNYLAEHVWEHLSPIDAMRAIENCFKYLKRSGRLRIAVPDGFHPDHDYINQVKPGGYGSGADDHKVLYNYQTLSAILIEAGFQVQLLEWFDEQGVFHFESWTADEGMVKRSTRYDSRNSNNPTAYTSLIIDAIKP